MPVFQSWNGRTNRWVKYKFNKSGVRWQNVKQRKPTVPFKGVPIRGNRKRGRPRKK